MTPCLGDLLAGIRSFAEGCEVQVLHCSALLLKKWPITTSEFEFKSPKFEK